MSADTLPRAVVSARQAAGRIALIYATFGVLWILFSDTLLGHFQPDMNVLVSVASIKGCAYVIITAGLLYVLVYRHTRALERSHRQVAEDERHLRRLIETTSEGIVIVAADDEARITFANDRLAHMLGYTAEELVGCPMLEVVDEQWREAARAHRLNDHGQASHYDLKLRHKDGRAVWVIASVNPLHDEAGRHFSSLGMLTDVTERMQTQRELDQFFLLSIDMLCIAGLDGCFKKVNPSFERVLGYTPDELLEHPFIEFVHPDDVPATMQQMERLAHGKPMLCFENRCRHKDGSYRWLSWCTVPVSDEGLLYAVARDMTEHQQSEEALRKSEATLRSVFAAAPIGIGVVTNRILGLTNARVSQITGYTAEELAQNSARLLYESDVEFERVGRERDGQLRRETVGSVESRWRRKDGSIIDVLLSSAFIDPSDPSGEAVFTATDITERKQSEAALRQSESRFRSIFEQSPIGIALYDGDGRLMDANPAFRDILGLAHIEQVRGLHIFDDSDLPEKTTQRLRDGESVRFEFRYDFARVRAEGKYPTTKTEPADLDVVITPWRSDAQTPPHGYLLQVQDFTARKHLEEQLRHAQKMEAIGQLAGGVSHDFNNILTAIFGNVELIRGTLGQPEDATPGLREGLEQIERSGQRAAALTRQLLSFSRRQVIKPEILNPQTILLDMEKMLRRLLPESVDLRLICGPETWHVRADSGQIEQVILNLAVNARDAMPNGGPLTIELSNRVLDETAEDRPAGVRSGPYVALTVRDAGCGMDPETMKHAFDPFFTTKPLGQGTGLGLATVEAIVRRAEGHIFVSSTRGCGTVFEILLPAITAACELAPRQIHAGASGGEETILVCEDDAAVRDVASRALRARGYTVLAAADARQALDLAAAHPGTIHLLATDIVMPGMSGRELAEALVARRPELKVLFVSGYAPNTTAEKGWLYQEAELLAKPFSSATLVQCARRALDRQPANGSA